MYPVLSANTPPSTGYNLTKSLRFRSSASAYLTRTPASAGNRQTATFSFWIKRGSVASDQCVLSLGTFPTNLFEIIFGADNTFAVQNTPNSTTRDLFLATTQVFRDPAAWYHIVISIDTTQATASNRAKMYVNGSQITAFGTATYPSQNTNLNMNTAVATQIGRRADGNYYQDAYLAEMYFIDGQALTPSSFGQTDSTTGAWVPTAYSGTYGTNGFYLPFTNTTSTTTLGNDSSGNGNNWTTNNFSLTAGATYDSMTDVPTLTSATTANYAVLNPLKNGGTAPSNGNLTIVSALNNDLCLSTIGMTSGKFYWEFVQTATSSGASVVGIAQDNVNLANYLGATANGWGYHQSGLTYTNGTSTSYGNTWTTNDIIGVAFDADNGKLYFSKNGTWQNSGNPATGTNPAYSGLTATPYFPTVQVNNTTTSSINFGQQPFTYTPPTGYVALNTYNLPTSTIVAGNTVMDATIWTGDGNNPRLITNAAGFKPDLVWSKLRSGTASNNLYDSVRGTGKVLYSDLTSAEDTNNVYGYLSAFNSNGFSSTAGSTSNAYFNANGSTYVGWQWQAGQGTTSTNTNGSITSTVSVNPTAGFSIVTYTGTGAAATVGHGLGVAPSFIAFKIRNNTYSWRNYHVSTGNAGYVYFNSTDGYTASSTTFNNTSPTSSVFSVGTEANTNASGGNFVAYCWAEVAGFSKFGSYTGNGSSDGTFVYLGFRPKFIMVKSTGIENWVIYDSVRGYYNVYAPRLYPNLSNAEFNFDDIDILSNGFKCRSTSGISNGNGVTYIYAAFAESPFKVSLAR